MGELMPPDEAPVVVVVPPVEIDYGSADRLATEIIEAFSSEPRAVAVDFSSVTFCDSTGLRVLINAARHARAGGVDFTIHHPTRQLLRMVDLLGAADLLNLPPPAPRR